MLWVPMLSSLMFAWGLITNRREVSLFQTVSWRLLQTGRTAPGSFHRIAGEVLGTVETDAFENSEEQSVLLSALFLSQVRPHVQRSQVPFDLPTNLPWVFFSNAPHTECSVSNIFVDFSWMPLSLIFSKVRTPAVGSSGRQSRPVDARGACLPVQCT